MGKNRLSSWKIPLYQAPKFQLGNEKLLAIEYLQEIRRFKGSKLGRDKEKQKRFREQTKELKSKRSIRFVILAGVTAGACPSIG